MSTRSIVTRALALTGILVAAPLARAAAQDTPVGVRPYRFTIEGLVSEGYFNDNITGGGKSALGGYGARVLFNRSTPAATLRSFAERASVGAFIVHTGKQGDFGLSTTHFGVQADVSMLPRPAYRGTLDPFFSLGVGGFRRKVSIAGVGDASSTDLAVTPAIGTRFSLVQGFGFRGDLRVPIVFGDNTGVGAVAEGGVFLSF